jgi:hypothetical protein
MIILVVLHVTVITGEYDCQIFEDLEIRRSPGCGLDHGYVADRTFREDVGI